MKLHGTTKYLLNVTTALGLVACSANPQVALPISGVSGITLAEEQYWSGLVNFDYYDFYTLTSPNTAGCAGDVMNLYDPISGRSLASNGTSKGTLLPAFIKNISVDVTDSNSTAATNLAFGCSYGAGSSTVPANTCATFDFPDNGGVSSNLSGATLLIGGMQGTNASGIPGSASCGPSVSGNNNCATSVYALGVDTLPASAATTPVNDLVPGLETASSAISSFVNLSSAASYAGPQDFLGAAGAYDLGSNQFALFGGSSVINALGGTGIPGPTGQATTNDTTWIFNLSKQTWSRVATSAAINVPLLETFEQDDFGSRNLSNQVTARAVFGYAAVQGLAVNAMSNTVVGSATQVGIVGGSNAYLTVPAVAAPTIPIDNTDRIVIVGGNLASNVVASDAFKFNPTYAPEWVDTLGRALNLTAGTAAGENVVTGGITPGAEPVQWLQNYHTQPLFNTSPSGTSPLSLFKPSPLNGTPIPVLNFGLAPLLDNTNFTHSGYLLYMGGFDMTQVSQKNPLLESCNGAGGGSCAMMINRRADRSLGQAGGTGSGESYPSSYSSVGNLPTAALAMTSGPTGSGAFGQAYSTTQLSPSYWDSYTGTSGVPYYGGSTLLPGFSLHTNDVVFFGGADCSNYILSSAVCTSFANPGAYFQMGLDPLAAGAAVPANVGFTGAPPAAAGMAAARGTDANGNPIIVAFGGMTAAGTSATPAISFLSNIAANAPKPATWGSVTPGGVGPAVVTNGALVFSHVTKKFYLFGGFNPVNGSESNDTWELSVTSANCGVLGSCTFSWRQLDVTNGLTCSGSNCATTGTGGTGPTARRSHRMVEANYNNLNPGGETGLASGESTCATTSPCSYGIFMEGGTPDGVNPISDRWMFDPTANDGAGMWQQMHEMPSRTLASMASVDYTIPSTSTTAHRAILFGGETGLADPSSAGNSFVAPTLGDTWMFDYDAGTWNRVQLLGTGYNGAPNVGLALNFNTSEFTNRQAYNAQNPADPATSDPRSTVAELSPPPTSGAMMVTRTLSGPSTATGAPAAALTIPEVYMIGGRKKDGSYQTFDHVYKFCAGTTGEAYTGTYPTSTPNLTDFSCDAYSTTNLNSPSPQTGYFGRWLRKTPGATGATANQLSSFMGAAAYDNVDDLIVVYGGLQFSGAATPFFVTDSASRSTATLNTTGGDTIPVFEYSPPSTTAGAQGAWNVFDKCPGSALPTNRYGHSMVYDSLHKQLIVVGGYDINGNALTENVSNVGGTFSIPDMWTATRNPTGSATAGPCYNWTQVTTIGNSFSSTALAPPQTGMSHMIAAYVPASGYSTGFYSTYDSACDGVGPIASPDPNQSKLLAGGVYFDIDRTQLGSNENLLLNLTFIPLGPSNDSPSSTALTQADQAVFRIHLVQTGQSATQLQSVVQPRFLTYTGNTNFPEVVQSLAVVSPPTGQPRTEQILIPLNENANIDRIRIERYSGTAILVNASLFRMGQK